MTSPNRYGAMKFKDYEYVEFPKFVYRLSGDKLENKLVENAAAQADLDDSWFADPRCTKPVKPKVALKPTVVAKA